MYDFLIILFTLFPEYTDATGYLWGFSSLEECQEFADEAAEKLLQYLDGAAVDVIGVCLTYGDII